MKNKRSKKVSSSAKIARFRLPRSDTKRGGNKSIRKKTNALTILYYSIAVSYLNYAWNRPPSNEHISGEVLQSRSRGKREYSEAGPPRGVAGGASCPGPPT